jgi:cation diffusion facilitator CzcD-associated flavoprotein CzcO
MKQRPIEPQAVAHAAAMPELARLSRPRDIPDETLTRRLDELEKLVRRDLDMTRYPAKSWVLPHTAPDGGIALDVLVVGGGQAGLAAAFGLLQQRVTNILVIDENVEGDEGPWNTYARMATLRTQKDTGGIEFGIPNLSFRAWYEAQHGQQWDRLYKLPTELWHRYLQWYRKVLDLPVRNKTRLRRLQPAANGLLAAEVEQDGHRSTLWTRTIVLATGIEGNGVRRIPNFIADGVPKQRWAHTHEAIDFAALAGQTVAVLGGGASAYDTAIAVAEQGADVHIFHRETQLVPTNATAWGEFNGFLAHFPDLSLLDRWRFTRKMRMFNTGPPQRTLERAAARPNLIRHPGCSWRGVALSDGGVVVDATDGPLSADFLILGTGYITDVSLVEEIAEHLPLMALWRDVFTPPAGEEDAGLASAPFLGPNFEVQEKLPGTAPWLGAVFNFSRGGSLSMGAMPIGLSGIKFGVPRLVHGVTKRLFVEDVPNYFRGMEVWLDSDAKIER